MKKLFLAGILLFAIIGCKGSDNKGIEVTNPNINQQQKFFIVPNAGNYSYSMTILSKTEGQIGQYLKTEPSPTIGTRTSKMAISSGIFSSGLGSSPSATTPTLSAIETIPTPLTFADENTFHFKALFSNKEKIEATLRTKNGNVDEILSISINDILTEAFLRKPIASVLKGVIIDELIDIICAKVNVCTGFSRTECEAGMENVSLSDELGLEEDGTLTMSVLRTEINSGVVTVNEAFEASCKSSITATDCTLLPTTITSTADLRETEELIGSECGNDLSATPLFSR